jgi:hypothetical protein
MRKYLIILLTLAAAALADSTYPYYPDVEERFCDYKEVTPLMAVKAAMLTGPQGDPPYVICEPLVLKRLSGMPVCYQITYYNGKNMKRAQEYNDLIRRINAGEKVPANELSNSLARLRNNGFRESCMWESILGQTFSAAHGHSGSKGLAPAFSGFDACYEKAASVASTDNLYFTRFIGVGWDILQTFEFETEDGDRIFIGTSTQPFPGIYETSYKGIENREKKTLRNFNDPAEYDMEVVNRDLVEWAEIEAAVPDEMAQEEFPKVLPRE